MQELLTKLTNEIVSLRSDLVLLTFDIQQIRKQLDKIELQTNQPQESIGIAPNTLPPDWLPPEVM